MKNLHTFFTRCAAGSFYYSLAITNAEARLASSSLDVKSNLKFTGMKRYWISLWVLTLMLSTQFAMGQNMVVGTGFNTAWPSNACNSTAGWPSTYMSGSAGTSQEYIHAGNGTGNQYWRFGVNYGSNTGSQYNTNGTSGPDVAVSTNTTYTLNTNCTSNGAMYYNVASTSYNYVFKTALASSAAGGTFTFFEVQGTVRSISSAAQSPVAASVFPGQAVTVTATLSGAFATGQAAYLRYTTNGYTSSTVVAMAGSGTTYTATIPASANTPGAAISYYVFTSGSAGVTAPASGSGVYSDGSNADFFTINSLGATNSGGYSTGSFTYTVAAGWTTAATGNWSTAATWTANAVPPTANDMGAVSILHQVAEDQNATTDALTVNIGTATKTLTINSGITLTTGGATGISGSNSVVFASATSTWAAGAAVITNGGTINMTSGGNLNIAAGGTLTNNSVFTGGAGTVTTAGAATINGSQAITFNNLTLTTGAVTLTTIPTINGTLTINGGHVTAAPYYTANSTLVYGVTYNRFIEWSATTAGTLGSTVGYPNHVTINVGTLTMYNSGQTGGGAMAGNLTINTGTTMDFTGSSTTFTVGGNVSTNGTGALSMSTMSAAVNIAGNLTNAGSVNMGTMGASMTVSGSVNSSGTFTLSGTSGSDLIFGGSLTNSGTYNDNGRATEFNGSGTGTLTSTTALNLHYLLLAGTGTLQLGNSNITLNGTASQALQFLNATTLDLETYTLTMATGTTILLNHTGVNNIQSTGGTGTLALAGTCTITPTSGSLTTSTNVDITLAGALAIGGTSALTVNGILQLNSGGSVTTNAPAYGTSSILIYNTGATKTAGTEWTAPATAEPGMPYNVQIGIGGTGASAGIGSGATSQLNFGSSTAGYTLAGTMAISSTGTLVLSTAAGTLNVGGNWLDLGTFTPGTTSTVNFNGAAVQTVTKSGGETFYNLQSSNSNSTGVTLGGNVTVTNNLTLTGGEITPSTYTLTFTNAGGGGINSTGTSSIAGAIAISSNTTFTVAGTLTVSGIISGSSTLITTAGTGTLSLGAANTYNGGTTIGGASTLQLGIANALSSTGTVTFAGGTLKSGATSGFSDNMGPISMTASSTLALGTGSHQIIFSSLGSFTSGKTLAITGWTASAGAGSPGSAGQVFIGSSNTLTSGQLAQITINGGAVWQLCTGEIVSAGTAPTVSIAITTGTNPTCLGSSITVTGTPSNGGTSPNYNFFVNSVSQQNTTSATYAYTPANGDVITCVITDNSNCQVSVASSSITETVNALTSTSVSVASGSGTTVCSATSVTFTATPTGGGSAPNYNFSVNGSSVQNSSSATYTYTPVNGDAITCAMTSNATCPNPAIANSNTVTMTVTGSVTPAVSIAITTGTNPTCAGNNITVTATPTNGGASPTYNFSVNGSSVQNSTTATYTYTPANGDVISCVMTSSNSCASPTTGASGNITMTVNALVTPAVGIAITTGTNPTCAGSGITVTATPTNGGASPTYNFKVNGTSVQNTTTATYTYNPANGDVITCVMTSNATCPSPATATSGNITMTVNALVTPAVGIAITSGSNPTCVGSGITVTATPTNGGASPTYNFKVNGTSVQNTTTATYSYTPANGDVITCVITSSNACASPTTGTSGNITMTVNPLVTPSVSIALTSGTNPTCSGSNVTVTATPTNGGGAPTYNFKVNGASVQNTTSATYTYAPANGDVITCVMTSANACASPATATSGNITMTDVPAPTVSAVGAATVLGAQGASNTGYYGQAINITGTNFSGSTTVSFNGTAAASVTYNSPTSLTAVVALGTAMGSGSVVLTNSPCGSYTYGTAFTVLGYVTTANGDWTTTGTWLGGNVPPAAATTTVNNVVGISSAIANAPASITINSAQSLTLNNAASAITSTTVINNGTLAWTAAGTLTIAATGTLTNNSTFTAGSGNVTTAGAATINGSSAITFNNLTITTGTVTVSTVPTINGTFTLNGGHVTAAPIYGAASTLYYNVTYSRFIEWTATTAGTLGTTPGYPNNVTVNTGTLTVYNAAQTGGGAMAGNLNINTGATMSFTGNTTAFIVGGNVNTNGTGVLSMSNMTQPVNITGNLTDAGSVTMGSMSSPINVAGSVNLSGTLTLSTTSGGDIKVGGNWAFTAGGTFTTNFRAVFFTGSTQQVISRSAAGTLNFDYVLNQNTGGGIQLSSGTNINFNSGNGGNGLTMSGSGTGAYFDLNGNTATFSTTASLALSGAVQNIISSSGTGNVIIASGSTTDNVNGSSDVIFGSTVVVQLNGGLNFGSNLSTINGTLQINAGGYVYTNAPNYNALTSALLKYNSGTTPYTRGIEWSTATGAGHPYNVELSNNTTLDPAGTTMTGTALDLAGNLTIDAGSSLYMDDGGHNMTVPLIIDLNLNLNGNLSESGSGGGDVNIGGNWINNGTGTNFFANARAVSFVGTTAQSLGGTNATAASYAFAYLTINNSAGVTLGQSISVANQLTLTSGLLTLGTYNTTISSGATISGGSSSAYVQTNGTGQLLQTVGATAVPYPVGNSAYNPITFTNSGTSDVYGVNVLDGTYVTPNDVLKIVNERWQVTEAVAGGSNLAVVAQFTAAEEAANFASGTNDYIGFYNGSGWTEEPATAAGSNPYTFTSTSNFTPANLTTGTQYFAVGKDDAFLCPTSVSIAITAGAQSICAGTSVTFTATPTSGGASPAYQWYKNGIAVGTNSNTYTNSALNNGDIVYCAMTSSLACAGGATVNSNNITMTVTANVTPAVSIAITSGTNPECAGSSVTFTATPTNGGGSPNYNFEVNGSSVQSGTSATYTTSTSNNNDVISCILTSSVTCVTTSTATSNTITMTVNPLITPSVTINASPTGAICAGTSVSYIASPTNGGSSPTYVFYANGTQVQSSTSAVYTSSSITNGEPIICNMTSNATCPSPATVSSNTINQSVNPLPAVFNVGGGGSYCSGGSGVNVYLNGSQNGVNYQLKNGASDVGSPVSGTGALINFGNQTLGTTYTVAATNATTLCVNNMSGSAVVTDNPVPATPGLIASANPTCSGSPVTFTASGGSQYGFYVNGTLESGPAATNTYTTSTLNNGDQVTATSFSPFTFDGNIIESAWGTPIQTSTGGPYDNGGSFFGGGPSFGAGFEINALYALSDANNINIAIAGNIQNGNRIMLFIQSTTGGYNNGSFGRTSAPPSLQAGEFNAGNTFDPNFYPNYCLVIGTNSGETDYFFDLYALSSGGGPELYLGDIAVGANNGCVLGANPANGTETQGFEMAIPKSLLSYTGGTVRLMAMLSSDGGFLSNQFLTHAAAGAGSYGSGAITFGGANPGSFTIPSVNMSDNCSSTSSAITMSIASSLSPSVSINASSTTICSGTNVTFTATPTNGGTAPTYQWMKNGNPVGTSSTTYSDNGLNNGDVIYCVLTSNATCVSPTTATSNSITMTVDAYLTPTVSIAASPSGAICAGTSVTFTATPTYGGSSPTYQWQKNSVNVGTGATYSSSSLANGDQIVCVLTSSATCASPTTATSNTITMTVNPVPNVYVVEGGGSYCAGGSGVDLTLSGSQTGVNYQLLLGATDVGSALPGTNNPLNFGNQTTNGTTYNVVATNGTTNCTSNMSGNATVYTNINPSTPFISASANPICPETAVMFTATGGSMFQFTLNGVAQRSESRADTFSSNTLTNGENVGVTSYSSIIYDGNIVENLWGSPLSTSTGGPSSGFGTSNEINAVYANGDGTNTNFAIAGTVSAGNQILLFIDSKAGGYNVANFNKTNAPTGLDNFNSGTTFNTGFNPDYCLVIGPNGASDDSFSLFTLAATSGLGTDAYLGGRTIHYYGVIAGGNPASGSQTQGFEISLPNTLIGYTGGNIQIMAMLISDGGFLSNQFLTPANISSSNFGSGAVYFNAPGNPNSIPVTSYIVENTCSTNSTPITMTVYPTPTLSSATTGAVCTGSPYTYTATSATAGTTFSWTRATVAGISNAAGSGASANISETLVNTTTSAVNVTYVFTLVANGCSNTQNLVVTVNPLPTLYNVTGGTNCGATTVGINLTDANVLYQLYYNGSPVGGSTQTGSTPIPRTWGSQTGVGTYTVVATVAATSCSATMNGSAVVEANPTVYTVGGGSNCASSTVTLSNSDNGINYQLYNGASTVGSALAGNGSGLTFGAQTAAGTYTVVATNATTGCTSNMSGSSSVYSNPTVYNVTGGTNCGATTVGLSGSDVGASYQLYNGVNPVGSPVNGDGTARTFGSQTVAGTYTVVATIGATSCTANMSGSAIVNLNPTAYTVGGGANCTSSDVTLSGSDNGVNYQLYNGVNTVGSPVAGTSSSLDFGPQTAAGTYTVVATNATTSCTSSMSGSSSVYSTPTVYSVTGGTNCGATTVGLSGSDVGASYQLYNGVNPVGSPVNGDGTARTFGAQTTVGTYTVVATIGATSCTANMSGSAIVEANPTVYTVGGGANCGTTDVTLSNSDNGVNYQLYNGVNTVGGAQAGNGHGLDFGSQSAVGTYTVVATNATTSCTSNMSGSAEVYSTPTVYNVTGGTGCGSTTVGVSGSDLGVNYQLYNGVNTVGSAQAGTGAAFDFGSQSATGTYTVVATVGASSCTANMSGSATVYPAVSAMASNGGPYVTGNTIQLNSSGSGGDNSFTYSWSGPSFTSGAQNPTIPSATVANSGIYDVTVTDGNHCTATATTDVVLSPPGVYTWTGNTSTDWTVTTNWNPIAPVGGPNACAADVIIPFVTRQPVISTPISVGNIQMNASAQLTLNSNISVCKNWTGGSGSNATVIGSGIVVLNGSTAQTISGSTQFNELQLNNSQGAALQSSASVSVYNALDLQTGTLNASSGTLTFLSTAVNQAAILDNFSAGNSGNLTGIVYSQRYYAASNTYNQHFMGSPVSTPLLSQFGASGTPGFVTPQLDCDEANMANGSDYGTVFSYHESNPAAATCGLAEWKVESGSVAATNGQGYSILKVGTGTLTLNGDANLNSSYTLSGLSNSNWANTSLQNRHMSSGWQLVSNPYQATLQINTTNSGFDDQIQVWNANGSYSGTYQVGTVGNDAIVAPFQAFMVHVTNPGNGNTYTINASDRVRTAANFYAQHDQELDIIAQNIQTGLLDQTMVAFDSRATEGFDTHFDANKFGGSLNRHTLYSMMSNGEWMARNVLNSINTTSTVNVGFEPGATGTYAFTFNNVNTFDPTSYIYLEDKQLNVMYNVRNGIYNFSSDSADNWNRFVLHFTPPANIKTVSATCNAPGSINIVQPGTANWTYSIVDANNTTIASGILNQSNPVSLNNLSAGSYILKLVDNNGYTVIKTVQVAGATQLNAAFNLPAATTTQSSVTFASASANATTYIWYISDGTTINGVSDPTYTFTEPGTYTVLLTITNAAGCSASMEKTIVVSEATGLSNITDNNGITMWSYENRVYVDFTQLAQVNAVIKIYDILGREISTDKFVSSTVYQKVIDNMEAAYVIVSVRNDDNVITRKLYIFNTK